MVETTKRCLMLDCDLIMDPEMTKKAPANKENEKKKNRNQRFYKKSQRILWQKEGYAFSKSCRLVHTIQNWSPNGLAGEDSFLTLKVRWQTVCQLYINKKTPSGRCCDNWHGGSNNSTLENVYHFVTVVVRAFSYQGNSVPSPGRFKKHKVDPVKRYKCILRFPTP